jgi:hypothetical protein
MIREPAWLPAAHLISFAMAWGLCIALGLAFGAQVGWTAFVIMEFRAVTAKMIDTTRRGAA